MELVLEPNGEFEEFTEPTTKKTCYRLKYKEVRNVEYICVDRAKQPRKIREKYADMAVELLINGWSQDPILACATQNFSPFHDSTEDRQDIDRHVVGNDLRNRRACSTPSVINEPVNRSLKLCEECPF